MANFKISSKNTTDEQGKGTLENPFKLTRGEGYIDVTSLNLNNSAIYWQGYASAPVGLQSVTNGTNTITNGDHFCYSARQLHTYICDMPNLTAATYMFSGCAKLETVISKMPELELDHVNADMFRGCPLKKFEITVKDSWRNVMPETLGITVVDDWTDVRAIGGGLIKLIINRETVQ